MDKVKIPKGIGFWYDQPDSRDYMFEDFDEYARGEAVGKRPKRKITIFNQWATPSCTMQASQKIVNAYNILEDERLWLSRAQVDPLVPWNIFCSERGDYTSGSSIQTMAVRHKRKGNISWYTSIKANEEKQKKIVQMKKALDMWFFLLTWSAFGDWWVIKQTWVYSERPDKKFVGHWRIIVDYDEQEQVFRAVNSYWPTRWIYKGYFKVPYDMVDRIYSCIVLVDRDDSHLFGRFEEIQKVKQAVALLRDVYNSTTLDSVKNYLEKEQFGKTFSEIYWTII